VKSEKVGLAMSDKKKFSNLYKAIFICVIVNIITCVILHITGMPALRHFYKLSHLEILLAAIGVIAFWRGLWGMMDEYLFPEDPKLSYLVSVIIGFSILLLTHFFVKEF
jgi:hypothetical protein